MPTYEYECASCGNREEHVQKITDEPLKKCAHCGEDKLGRLISPSPFVLKGGGWFKDGYGSGSGSK